MVVTFVVPTIFASCSINKIMFYWINAKHLMSFVTSCDTESLSKLTLCIWWIMYLILSTFAEKVITLTVVVATFIVNCVSCSVEYGTSLAESLAWKVELVCAVDNKLLYHPVVIIYNMECQGSIQQLRAPSTEVCNRKSRTGSKCRSADLMLMWTMLMVQWLVRSAHCFAIVRTFASQRSRQVVLRRLQIPRLSAQTMQNRCKLMMFALGLFAQQGSRLTYTMELWYLHERGRQLRNKQTC